MGRTGSADLPLHEGRVPQWLGSRLARLGEVMVEALVLEEGPHGVLRRLAHPFWFQALGCVMGMDWHSSGITTGALRAWGGRTALEGAPLARTSRLVAKVDSAAVQDGFELYLHGFVVASDG